MCEPTQPRCSHDNSPDERKACYQFSVVDPFYNNAFLQMIEALIQHNVPFAVYNLGDIVAVAYSQGEFFSDVNKMGWREPGFFYRAKRP